MAKLNADVSVDEDRIVERLESAIEDGIRDGAEQLGEDGIEKARYKIVEEGAVWKGELIASFNQVLTERGDTTVIEIENTSDHAKPVENGAEYGSTGPPIQSLLPWVRDNLSHWVPDYDTWNWMKQKADWLRKNGNFDGWGDVEIGKAYWLHKKIKDEGLEPVKFMEFAEEWLERHGSFIVKNNIEKHLRRRGLK